MVTVVFNSFIFMMEIWCKMVVLQGNEQWMDILNYVYFIISELANVE